MFVLRRTGRLYPTYINQGARMEGARAMGASASDSGGRGSIKQAGGKFADMEVAKEEEYFYKLRQEQLKSLKEHKVDEQSFREKAIEQHQNQIDSHQKAIDEMKN